MASAEKNHFDCFDFLIKKEADIMATREDGADAVYIAARYGHHEIIERIVQMDKSSLVVNRPTFRRRTAFLTAAFHGHKLVCAKLLRVLNDINHKDTDGCTGIMYASNKGDIELVKWLTQNGAKIEYSDSKKMLNYGIECKDVEVTKELVTCETEIQGSVNAVTKTKQKERKKRYKKKKDSLI